jgi:hypothetical protein
LTQPGGGGTLRRTACEPTLGPAPSSVTSGAGALHLPRRDRRFRVFPGDEPAPAGGVPESVDRACDAEQAGAVKPRPADVVAARTRRSTCSVSARRVVHVVLEFAPPMIATLDVGVRRGRERGRAAAAPPEGTVRRGRRRGQCGASRCREKRRPHDGQRRTTSPPGAPSSAEPRTARGAGGVARGVARTAALSCPREWHGVRSLGRRQSTSVRRCQHVRRRCALGVGVRGRTSAWLAPGTMCAGPSPERGRSLPSWQTTHRNGFSGGGEG